MNSRTWPHPPGNTRARHNGSKYLTRTMTPEIEAQPLVQMAHVIAKCRGFQHHSARWWQVLHTAHEQLQGAHERGQTYGIAAVIELVERIKPQSIAGEALTQTQRIEAEAIDQVLEILRGYEPRLPETPSTGK